MEIGEAQVSIGVLTYNLYQQLINVAGNNILPEVCLRNGKSPILVEDDGTHLADTNYSLSYFYLSRCIH